MQNRGNKTFTASRKVLVLLGDFHEPLSFTIKSRGEKTMRQILWKNAKSEAKNDLRS
jgi:hypothetical protein